MSNPNERCRLVLCASLSESDDPAILSAIQGGDVSSILLFNAELPSEINEGEFLSRCKTLVPQIQKADVATIIVDDTQAFGRSGADGLLVKGSDAEIADAMNRYSPQHIVGCAGLKERHRALVIGELNPDFVFFGKINGDTHPEPHKKNLALGEWWSHMVEIPCVVMAGSNLESAINIAKCGAEFVAMGRAIFDHEEGPAIAVRQVNKMLDEHAPVFE